MANETTTTTLLQVGSLETAVNILRDYCICARCGVPVEHLEAERDPLDRVVRFAATCHRRVTVREVSAHELMASDLEAWPFLQRFVQEQRWCATWVGDSYLTRYIIDRAAGVRQQGGLVVREQERWQLEVLGPARDDVEVWRAGEYSTRSRWVLGTRSDEHAALWYIGLVREAPLFEADLESVIACLPTAALMESALRELGHLR